MPTPVLEAPATGLVVSWMRKGWILQPTHEKESSFATAGRSNMSGCNYHLDSDDVVPACFPDLFLSRVPLFSQQELGQQLNDSIGPRINW